MASLTYALMVREVRNQHLYTFAPPTDMFARTYVRIAALVTGFALSIPVSLVTNYSYVCWIVSPYLFGVLYRSLWNRRAGVTPV